ncbi:MAG: four helix bundle protein [Candidatus Edwardsbacteria bacterium RIFOXYD12_FULL_50_11]|uniref:Four helix bundle protein n=1 Tax=Candidatus Edwardsbacteria bacterium GWF2_54_11 TaxID=1817851 RepID=A0A1F5RD45_9BACT|nr:MAG: four helix bundle protein [Candidatus Edwardsbacteria bacterium RifOxyC12_full_54_24]OGF07448.1 MAG: four helix bundle protein [Candidatus Edwardsbacteria bacterium RifOxyA12_full_54_48]OGF09698.1 MAG: four helix bundle protein [Candidatus Edwardsbacteria bacterium GWE2_54_12]OGF11961.1 MAG: four helix bundle protein [Candidatus Edwardsbacteria bacterium GWF2_54_11]OGF18143.1 MAG: four helix bundle protein [Candidatus Edwardsbacteria bacterium RIFOXYD12_FULL_50_11]OGJ19613.1 MAG: four 
MYSTKSFADLIVWQKSYKLCIEIYKITKAFPSQENFGLTSQIRRCSVSIPSNIAEGYARKNRKEYIQFLYTANGSLAELQTQLMLSKDIGYLKENDFTSLYSLSQEIGRMLWKMIVGLRQKEP